MSTPSPETLPPLTLPDTLAEPQGKKRKTGKIIWMLVGGLALGALLGYLGSTYVPKADNKLDLPLSGDILLFSGILFFAALPILIHELGHVFAGWLAGFSFYMLIWGPFKVVREGEGIGLHLNKSLALAGGIAISVPTGQGRFREKMLLHVAGGPVASLLTGALALLVSMAMPESAQPESVSRKVFELWLLVFTAASFGIGLITLIPGTTAGFKTDGAQIISLLRNNEQTQLDLANFKMMTLARTDQSPAMWPKDEVALLETNANAVTRVLLFNQRVAVGRYDRAHAVLQQMLGDLKDVPAATHGNYYIAAAFFEGAIRKDLSAAEGWLAKVDHSPLLDTYTLHCAQAALARLREDDAQYAEHLAECESLAAAEIFPGIAKMQYQIIASL